MAEVFLTQPSQSVAGSKWMSDDLYNRAARKKPSLDQYFALRAFLDQSSYDPFRQR